MKTFKVNAQVWKSDVYFWICTPEEAQRKYQSTSYAKDGHTTTFEGSHGKTLYVEGVAPIVWVHSCLKKNDLIAALTHEIE